jgi:hypothetical protein
MTERPKKERIAAIRNQLAKPCRAISPAVARALLAEFDHLTDQVDRLQEKSRIGGQYNLDLHAYKMRLLEENKGLKARIEELEAELLYACTELGNT